MDDRCGAPAVVKQGQTAVGCKSGQGFAHPPDTPGNRACRLTLRFQRCRGEHAARLCYRQSVHPEAKVGQMPQDPDPTLSDRIFADLSRRVLSGDLAPGSKLRQDEIATGFQASHVPVREAFRRLEAEGLLEALPRRGVRVAVMDAARHFEVLEMRAALESLALHHAAERYPRGHMARVVQADRACSLATDAETWETANRDFHRLLIAPCPLPHLMRALERLQVLAQWGGRVLAPQRAASYPREDRDHRAILQALQEGAIGKAGEVLTRHIRRAHVGRQIIDN